MYKILEGNTRNASKNDSERERQISSRERRKGKVKEETSKAIKDWNGI